MVLLLCNFFIGHLGVGVFRFWQERDAFELVLEQIQSVLDGVTLPLIVKGHRAGYLVVSPIPKMLKWGLPLHEGCHLELLPERYLIQGPDLVAQRNWELYNQGGTVHLVLFNGVVCLQ